MSDIDFILIFLKKVELHAYRDLLDMLKLKRPKLCQECTPTITEFFEKLEEHFKKILTNKLHCCFPSE